VPSIDVLYMGPHVQEVAQRDLHEDLLDAGILGVLKAWLEPMSDGTLPNLKIRSAVLRTLINLNFLYEVRHRAGGRQDVC